MTRSNSRQDDERRQESSRDRVSSAHGGELVKAVSDEELVSFNDADCKHVTLVRDPEETEFIAFVCANPNCNEVVLFDKSQ